MVAEYKQQDATLDCRQCVGMKSVVNISKIHNFTKRNLKGRVYEAGKPLLKPIREDILDLYNRGYSKKEISRNAKVSERTITNILNHFQQHGTRVSIQ
jgi:DNA-binding NarL/FixJ family response regulator